MKVVTPEISWHERDPIYSIDFQPGKRKIQRLASGGVDKIVRIWQLSLDNEGKGQIDFLSNLRRHTASVNIVRFSKNGELLASAGDDSAIILWKLSNVSTPPNIFADEVEEDKESWVCHKTLRGHLGDVADLCWSQDNRYLVSGSVDNSAVVWDVIKEQRLAVFSDHKSYVQGVAFDPLGDYISTLSADRSMRLYSLKSKSCVHNISKMSLPSNMAASPQNTSGDSQSTPVPEAKPKSFRLFHDDSLRSFFRRLEFSSDGQLLVAPAGCVEIGDKLINASFMFARGSFSKPAVYLPSLEKSTIAVRMNPQLYELKKTADKIKDEKGKDLKEDKLNDSQHQKSMFNLPHRVVFAVATEDSVLIYDSQQTMPIGLLKNIHYHLISDLSWTSDGQALIIASTDGFCTIVTFEKNELGIPLHEEVPALVQEFNESRLDSPAQKSDAKNSSSHSQKIPFSRYVSDESLEKDGKMSDKRSDPSSKQITNGHGSENCNRSTDSADVDTTLCSKPERMEMETSDQKELTKSAAKNSEEKTSSECTQKKRIQFTTLSLLSKQ